MSRLDYRRGIAPIRTASELAVLLPVPLMMIVDGYASPFFPNSTPSSPSPFVRVMYTKLKSTFPRPSQLPIDVHWSQWESVCVPLLSDGRLTTWRGQVDLSCAITLTESIIGPGGAVITGGTAGTEIGFSLFCTESTGRLFGCDPNDLARVTGKTSQYLDMVMKLILKAAQDEGY